MVYTLLNKEPYKASKKRPHNLLEVLKIVKKSTTTSNLQCRPQMICMPNLDILKIHVFLWHTLYYTYTAFSLKEIGANPGGTARTFWLPV